MKWGMKVKAVRNFSDIYKEKVNPTTVWDIKENDPSARSIDQCCRIEHETIKLGEKCLYHIIVSTTCVNFYLHIQTTTYREITCWKEIKQTICFKHRHLPLLILIQKVKPMICISSYTYAYPPAWLFLCQYTYTYTSVYVYVYVYMDIEYHCHILCSQTFHLALKYTLYCTYLKGLLPRWNTAVFKALITQICTNTHAHIRD